MYVRETAKNDDFWVNQEIFFFPAIKLFHAVLLSQFLTGGLGSAPHRESEGLATD